MMSYIRTAAWALAWLAYSIVLFCVVFPFAIWIFVSMCRLLRLLP